MMEGVPTKILGRATLRHSALSIIHYLLLLLLIIIFIITIIIIIDELYFPRLVNCFLLFYYLI